MKSEALFEPWGGPTSSFIRALHLSNPPPRQQKSVDVVDLHAPPAVDELDEAEVLLLQRLVHLLVLSVAQLEILVRPQLIGVALVVVVVHLGLPDVAVDDGFVGAHRLDEEGLEGKPVELFADPLPPRARGVCGVEDGHAPAVEPALFQVAGWVSIDAHDTHVFALNLKVLTEGGGRGNTRAVLFIGCERRVKETSEGGFNCGGVYRL